jgi:coenzyme F420 biosynthesis associated uncharacterized protein
MSTAEGGTAAEMVDWQLATGVAHRLLRPGPEVTRAEATEVVAQLRQFAADSEHHVRDFTGLEATTATAPVVVVDRAGWVQANADGFRIVLQPLAEKIRQKQNRPGVGVASAVGSRVTAVEAGALLAFLSSRVLGQFDPFYPAVPELQRPELTGRLLLVAPNVMHVEAELGVVPRDFRLWVCLHEETHRVQFTAVPWLRDHLNTLIGRIVGSAELDSAAVLQMLADGVRRVTHALRTGEDVSIVDLVQTPAQRETIDQITAVMSLLEGHADVVMDSVGPSVVPSVADIRRRFNVRRQGQGFDKVVRRLLGLDAKMRQYRDGAHFCRTVIEAVGMSGFNQVWTSPDTLPTRDEIADPARWLSRMSAAAA